ncbi:MAG: deoxyribonuclease V [Pseudomonadota bacterium]|nr:deoxyribonuclease V [Syntrophaceae bacterium]MDI9555408.1 deoxyribonuclease V [Pseudomonadota bacterium]NLX30764.1 deoxyribonuclease V [Deltaproteobacteria bacterium]HNU84266.1 deoxyribonuclease V [Syntrophales bacterium]HNZ33799.1 deoxyribonuclease V [Syntrophales bacterium]
MKCKNLHPWDVDYRTAVAIQEKLRGKLTLKDRLRRDIRLVAGADISCSRGDDRVYAAVVILDAGSLDVLEAATYCGRAPFPYIPGLLSFREGPPLLRAFEKLRRRPDVVLFDGQGIAHPRGFGLAAHMGLLLGVPAVGCAKTRLTGSFEEPGPSRGQSTALMHEGRIIGSVVRTRDRVKPVFVSPGHRVGHERAVDIVLRCSRRYRIPEPTRQAHILVNKIRRQAIRDRH